MILRAVTTENILIWNNEDCDGDGVFNFFELELDTDLDGIDNLNDEDDDGDQTIEVIVNKEKK